ncbi:unnamed protein product [Symbiodinium sp. CCMP2592]|nr:unnamed protein product [Symbiodinium sp. CCMP2592]
MERFLHRGRDGRILDVDEFQVAKALLAGETELLSQEVDSEEHLFDLCCRFGHESTAAAMISYRVPGCVFKGSHRLRPPAVEPPEPQAVLEHYWDVCECECEDWNTCGSCSWGSSDEQGGLWMENWNASLQDAKNAAESAAAMPLVCALLEAFGSQVASQRIATDEAIAYLLDVAILIGDAELARSCAKHCTRFPLRRWRFQEFVRIVDDDFPCFRAEILEKDVLIAALAAGLELKQLTNSSHGDPVSLAEAVVLSGDAELWQRVEGLQLQLGPWRKHGYANDMADFLLENSGDHLRMSPERLHRAERAGLALSTFRAQVVFRCQRCGDIWYYFSLLDLAILLGQSDCARLCGAMDIVATQKTLKASLEAMPRVCKICRSTSWRIPDEWAMSFASLPERRAAAAEALHTALQASRRKTASSAGFGLFQSMSKWARGKRVPRTLVKLVLSFAAERPSLLQALEGREAELPFLNYWWEESMHREGADSQSPQPDAASQVQAESLGVTERPPAGAAGSSSNDVQAQPDSTSEKESGSDQDTTNDLLTALRNSKSDMPPLSPEGAVVFRLSRQNNAPRVNGILLDATGPLAELHLRVLEAGCEVAPKWSPVKALFIPVTEPQMHELLHPESAHYELGKTHILALLSDRDLIDGALRQLPKITRPKLRRDTPKEDAEGDAEAAEEDEEDEPMIVLEGGLRTDSSVGFPPNPWQSGQ